MEKIEASEEYELKVIGLCIIQLIGSLIAFLIHLASSHWGVYSISDSVYWIMYALLLGLLLLSIGIAALTKRMVRHFWSPTWRVMTGQRMRDLESSHVTKGYAVWILRLFIISDLLIAIYCVMKTGGSGQSIYSPFLFIIVPMIAIIDILKWQALAGYTMIVFIFYILAQFSWIYALLPGTDAYAIKHAVGHSSMRCITTILCSTFPTLFMIIQHRIRAPESLDHTVPNSTTTPHERVSEQEESSLT